MIDGQTFFNQLAKNDQRTYDNTQKVLIGQGDDYAIGCLLQSRTIYLEPNGVI